MDLPFLILRAEGTVPARDTHLGMAVELSLFALTQYVHYNFDSMVKFGDAYLGCNEYGIFVLSGSTDNNIEINAFFELLTSDFGIPNQKRIRKLYLGYEASGSLVLGVMDDENNVRQYILPASLADQRQHGARLGIGRDGKGRYWSFKLGNVGGCDFSIDSIDALITILTKKPGKTSLNKANLLLSPLETYRTSGG